MTLTKCNATLSLWMRILGASLALSVLSVSPGIAGTRKDKHASTKIACLPEDLQVIPVPNENADWKLGLELRDGMTFPDAQRSACSDHVRKVDIQTIRKTCEGTSETWGGVGVPLIVQGFMTKRLGPQILTADTTDLYRNLKYWHYKIELDKVHSVEVGPEYATCCKDSACGELIVEEYHGTYQFFTVNDQGVGSRTKRKMYDPISKKEVEVATGTGWNQKDDPHDDATGWAFYRLAYQVPKTRQIVTVLKSEDDDPLEGATCSIWANDRVRGESKTQAPDGVAVLDVPLQKNTKARIRCERDGYVSKEKTIRVGTDEPIIILKKVGHRARGFVGLSLGIARNASFPEAHNDGALSFDETNVSSVGGAVFGGVRFNDYVALEASYADLGSYSFVATSSGSLLWPPGAVSGTNKSTAFGLGVIGIWPFKGNFRLRGMLRARYWKTDENFVDPSGVYPNQDGGGGVSAGLGIGYRVKENWLVHLDSEHQTTETSEPTGPFHAMPIDMVSFGFTFEFGAKQ